MSVSNNVVAVVLAAGKGTRMRSRRPKVLHEVAGKPLVSWSIDAVKDAGCGDVVVVVGHGAEDVTAMLQKQHPGVRTAVQTEQKGTGHAVMMALPALPDAGTAVVVCGDTPFLTSSAIAQLLTARGKAPVALWTTRQESPRGYGRIVRNASGSVCGIVEEKDATPAQREINEINPGVYAFDIGFLRESLSKLTTANAAGEYYLTDLIKLCAQQGGNVESVEVDADITDGINDRIQLADAEVRARDLITTKHLTNGVSLVLWDSVFIGPDVVIGEDTVIHPHVSLWGKTRIGRGCVIGQGSVLRDATIEDDVTVNPYSLFDQCVVHDKAVIGPFSRLRPEADVGEGAHVGNFVELKKTRLGKGSKANHLAYLGDADIGAGVNVGAGTITCNYDGIGKHKTTLEDGVFVGSNSTLVAPVVVGKDAYVAAGSVVTADVPGDAIAFGRAQQVNKEGRATTLRAKNAERAGKAKK